MRSLRGADSDLIDEALVLRFDAEKSFTGEATVELQTHGSVAVIRDVLDILSTIPGFRLAEPGEFTRRALENGNLDLSQVEGLADLIDAETRDQRQQALRVFSGELGRKVAEWRKDLVRASALIELSLDFSEEDIPDDIAEEIAGLLGEVHEALSREIEGTHAAERIRDGFTVAIIGAPNAGKSTLLNRLAGREAAITSEIAGTTRDVIEVRMNIGGLPVMLLDTAGLRETHDEIEALGVQRAVQRATAADLRIFLMSDADEAFPIDALDGDLRLWSKADLNPQRVPGISGFSGTGVADMLAEVESTLRARIVPSTAAVNHRHRTALIRGRDGLDSVLERIKEGESAPEISAELVRAVIIDLESLIGSVDVETLYDEIFSSFCLGK
ncbi:tRNA modification GTPase MnmE [Profundibacterium mesophilum KAUST100406-0324]|uniref:tRNA modification GTPase MnmE n=1 Tax=Profundibacterium mesophilum KAUST100406-0324 TaxID=1037889 RepID=A0A921TFC4_9RHOB|nr:tRNA modification GTPase MnmE [Profundibacterium mesophilum KAUST100406-0324]